MNNSKRNFSFSEFCNIASRSESDFQSFGSTVKIGNGEGSTYTFTDNNSDVLGVAHLDTVQGQGHSSLIKVKNERLLMSPKLDDRLGVYIITRLLPKLGITCDWLLTTGEEIGCSSAELFKTDKKYNWAFSFDRAGTDVVLYQHDHKALRKLLRKSGFRVSHGTFSDLSSLDIGCSGINFGCGYEDAHSVNAYAILSDTFRMTDAFVKFWRKHSDQRLPYNPDKAEMLWRKDWHDYSTTWRPSRSNNGYYDTGSGYWAKDGREGYTPDEKAYLDWSRPRDDWQEQSDMAQCDYCGNYTYDVDWDGIAHACDDCSQQIDAKEIEIRRFKNNGR